MLYGSGLLLSKSKRLLNNNNLPSLEMLKNNNNNHINIIEFLLLFLQSISYNKDDGEIKIKAPKLL